MRDNNTDFAKFLEEDPKFSEFIELPINPTVSNNAELNNPVYDNYNVNTGLLAAPPEAMSIPRLPKDIARITVCGGFQVIINDQMAWTKPTPEQIKNLKETFCIDVEIFDEE